MSHWLRNRYYIKLMFSIITFSMAMVILFSVVFSNIYSDALSERMLGEYEANISNINAGFENLNKEMSQLYLLLQMDISAYSFLNEYEKDDVIRTQAYMSAEKIYKISPYVDSIVLYNVNTGDYILTGTNAFDPAYTVEQLQKAFKKNFDTKIILPNRAETEDVRYQGTKSLISLAYATTTFNKKAIDSIVIINLDRDATQNGILEKGSGTTFVYDSSGREITYPEEQIREEGIPVKTYFDVASSEPGLSGSKIMKIRNESKVVTYLKNSNYGWTFVNTRSYDDLLGGIRDKRNGIILIGLILLTCCLPAGYFISRLLYSPIKKITRTFRQSKYADGINSQGDISLITEVYEEALKHVGNLEKKNENYLPKIKEDFLRNILRFGDVDGSDVKLGDYQVEIEFSSLFVAVVETGYSILDTEDKRSFFEAAIVKSALNLLEKNFKAEAVNMSNGQICLLLNFLNEKNNNMDMLLAALEQLKELLVKMSGSSVTIGIGGVANGIGECQNAYLNALEMVKYRFVLGYGRVIHRRMIEENLTSSTNYPKEIEKKLISAIHMNNRSSYAKHLENIVETLKNYMLEDVMLILYQIVVECIRAMNEVTEGFKQQTVNFGELGSASGRICTLDQMKDWMLEIFDRFQENKKELDSVKTNKYYELIEEIKAYINTNFADVNLGVEMLAEMAGYTPNYFAKIFKAVTGQYVIDFIRQVRITKSKEFLKNTEHSINEISILAGFINSTYFYSAFKKDVGLTPAQYRNYKSNI